MYVERDGCMWKEMHVCEKKCTYVKRNVCMSQEMYVCEKNIDTVLFTYIHLCNLGSIDHSTCAT